MEIKLIYAVLIIIATALLFTIIGYIIRKQSAERKIRSAEEAASAILRKPKQAKAVKEKIIEAGRGSGLHKDLDQESRERRDEVKTNGEAAFTKEETLDRKTAQIERKEEEYKQRESEIRKMQEQVAAILQQQLAELEKISGMTSGKPRYLLTRVG